MSNGPLAKLHGATAAEICARFDLKKEAQSLLREGMAARDFIDALLANQQYVAGIDFMAHALWPREAVWWGCLCLQHACGGNLSPVDTAACKAAVLWVLEPNEENRRSAQTPAAGAGPASPAGQLAMAANHASGNIDPSNLASMPPGAFAPAQAVARAVKMASIGPDPASIFETQRLFVELGISVAEGRFVPPEVRNRAPHWR